MSGFKTDNNTGDIYYDDVEYVAKKTKKAKISTAAGTGGAVDINLSYQNTPGSNDYTVDSKISLVPGEGLSFAQDSGAGTITLVGTPKNNLSATVDPTRTDDASQGYAVGSIWKNTFTEVNGTKKNRLFYCNDATNGSANWINLEKSVVRSAAPGITNDGGLPDANNPDRGFAVGSIWLDISDVNSPKLYVCVSTAVGAASWKEIGGGSSSGAQLIISSGLPGFGGTATSDGTIWIKQGSGQDFVLIRTQGSPTYTDWAPLSIYHDVTDASGTSYPTGTIWYNATGKNLFICTDRTAGTWTSISTPVNSNSDPTTSNNKPEGTIWVNENSNKSWISVDQTAGTWQPIGSGLPSGDITEIQFNKNGAFGASNLLYFEDGSMLPSPTTGDRIGFGVGTEKPSGGDGLLNPQYNYHDDKFHVELGGGIYYRSHRTKPKIVTTDTTLSGDYGLIIAYVISTPSITITLPSYSAKGTFGANAKAGMHLRIKRADLSGIATLTINVPTGYYLDTQLNGTVTLAARESLEFFLSVDYPVAGFFNWLII